MLCLFFSFHIVFSSCEMLINEYCWIVMLFLIGRGVWSRTGRLDFQEVEDESVLAGSTQRRLAWRRLRAKEAAQYPQNSPPGCCRLPRTLQLAAPPSKPCGRPSEGSPYCLQNPSFHSEFFIPLAHFEALATVASSTCLFGKCFLGPQ